MSRRQRAPLDRDAATVRRTSRRVGWQITAGATVIVCLVVILSVAFVIDQSQPRELLEKPARGQTKIYVDSDDVLIALVVVGIFAVVVAGLLSWIVARRAVRPLGDALRIQSMFVADASHELRTPLAVLDARIQVLQRRLPPGHDDEADVAAIRRDARALIDVVDDLLMAAAAEPQDRDVGAIDIGVVLRETIESMRVLAAQRKIGIDLDAEPGILAHFPSSSLRRCVVALLDNAITHSPDASTVSVALRTSKTAFEVIVSDEGSGIRWIDPARIFDRFAHSDAPHSSGTPRGGFGIGLSLVWDVVARYGGTVEVRDSSGAGTTIAFTLPRA